MEVAATHAGRCGGYRRQLPGCGPCLAGAPRLRECNIPGQVLEGMAGVSPDYLAIGELKIAQARRSARRMFAASPRSATCAETAKRFFGRELAVDRRFCSGDQTAKTIQYRSASSACWRRKARGWRTVPLSMQNLVPYAHRPDIPRPPPRSPSVLAAKAACAGAYFLRRRSR